MSGRRSLIVLVVATAGCAAMLAFAFPLKSPFNDPDAIHYLEAARSLRAGENLLIPPWGWKSFDGEAQPLEDFPAGFPVTAALISRLGCSPKRAVVAIPAIAYVLLPFALFYALRRVLPTGDALAAAIVPSFLVATAYHGTLAMSDTPYLFLVAIGFGLLFSALESGGVGRAFAAGIVAGIALSFRNVGAAAPVAVAAGLAAAGGAGILAWRTVARLGVAYAIGAIVAYAPVVVRNVVTFGSIQPWEMVPASVPWSRVVREFLDGWAWMLFGNSRPDPATAGLVGAGLVVSFVWLATRGRPGGSPARPGPVVAAGILTLYAALGTALVGVTRHRFEVDSIGDRFLLQYHWIVVAGFLGFARAVSRRAGSAGSWMRPVLLGTALLGLVSGQVLRLGQLRREIVGYEAAFRAFDPIRPIVAALPGSTVVTSTLVAPQLQERFGRPVLQLFEVTPAELADRICPERDLVVLVHSTGDPGLASWDAALAGQLPSGYRELARFDRTLALACDRREKPPGTQEEEQEEE